MTVVVAFFNNKAGVGRTTLLDHVAWMMHERGVRALAVDLDPQANLTSAFLDDDTVEALWAATGRRTIYGAIAPLLEGEGGVAEPYTYEIAPGLNLVPGDLLLSGAEQELSTAWPNAGDHVVVPLAPDLYSLQGLRNLGPTLRTWRQAWRARVPRGPAGFYPPPASMQPAGYVVLQRGVRLDRVVGAYSTTVGYSGPCRVPHVGPRRGGGCDPADRGGGSVLPRPGQALPQPHPHGPGRPAACVPAPLRRRGHRRPPASRAGRLRALSGPGATDPRRRGPDGRGHVARS